MSVPFDPVADITPIAVANKATPSTSPRPNLRWVISNPSW
jgi:hypothetical protein